MTNTVLREPSELVAHAHDLRTYLSDELPNGVGNTIDALCDLIEHLTPTPEPSPEELSYRWAHEDAVEMGYPSLTEALEHLSELRASRTPSPSLREALIELLDAVDTLHETQSRIVVDPHAVAHARAALSASPAEPEESEAWQNAWPLGLEVEKIKGSHWHGKVVGYYSTELTPHGIAVESNRERGSVQIYPVAALRSTASGGDTV